MADPAHDPLWHACGMACLQMILDLVRGCRAYGGYREEACGAIKGLYYVRAGHNVDARVLPHLVIRRSSDRYRRGPFRCLS
ncbi:hypothetical protein GCM10010404_62130 [Nonomuraea africana]|uniref:Peptidase C39 domain-containing protein n=1 Tax=Nonomuraea africana TaxID=46171 RepID=A0ABR9K6B7_9ACTN|nr:hypothetical protein [Nonomuraea africana]MBE1557552.1 hypothetical protein [Nonomuraea africana]